MYAMISE